MDFPCSECKYFLRCFPVLKWFFASQCQQGHRKNCRPSSRISRRRIRERMTEEPERTMNLSFNHSDERAHELIMTVAKPLFEKFLRGKATTGDLLSAFADMDNLTTNEKCFLTAHCAEASMVAIQEMQKKQKIAALIQEGIL